MRNISLCNIIDKTAAKYFTQAKYFTVYDQTTICELCTLYIIVNVEECKLFAIQYYRQTAAKYFTQAKYFTGSLCMIQPQGVHYALSMYMV